MNVSHRIPPSMIQLLFKIYKKILSGRKVFPHKKGKRVLCQHADFPVINHRSDTEVNCTVMFVARVGLGFYLGRAGMTYLLLCITPDKGEVKATFH